MTTLKRSHREEIKRVQEVVKSKMGNEVARVTVVLSQRLKEVEASLVRCQAIIDRLGC